jgi:hypothetical protein
LGTFFLFDSEVESTDPDLIREDTFGDVLVSGIILVQSALGSYPENK